jgi:hypothetical protein
MSLANYALFSDLTGLATEGYVDAMIKYASSSKTGIILGDKSEDTIGFQFGKSMIATIDTLGVYFSLDSKSTTIPWQDTTQQGTYLGTGAKGLASSAVAIGSSAEATTNCVAIGANSQSKTSTGTAVGANTKSTGNAVAVGNSAEATAGYSIAIGNGIKAAHDYGVGIGRSTTAAYSIAIGSDAIANISLGQLDLTINSTNIVFKVGNRTFTMNLS